MGLDVRIACLFEDIREDSRRKEASGLPLKKIVGRVEKKGEVGVCSWRKLTGGNVLGFVLLSEGDNVQRRNNHIGRLLLIE